MGRWQPNAPARLREAALDLYGERGYDQTTVAEIADRAGLTERTFFRHFADKREVLFAGSNVLQDAMVGALAASPASTPPIDAVARGAEAAAGLLTDREYARRRQQVIGAHTELRERELIKLAALAAGFAAALRERGVAEPAASLAAEAGVTAFKVGFERWIAPGNKRGLAVLIRDSLARLKAVTAGR